MKLTEELMGGLLRSDYEYPDDPAWICQLINDDPVRGQKFIDSQIASLGTYAEKMKFLFGLKVCFEYTIKDLQNRLEDELYPVSCCSEDVIKDSENKIRRYTSALLKIDCAIRFETDCNEIPCEGQPKGKSMTLTPHQWALALHVFFKVLGIETTNGGQINQVLLARFAHLITGEECPAIINNSKFLDYLKAAPHFDRTSGRKTVQDLETVRIHFEWVGISEALQTIDTLILQYKKI